ncbi:hypothetical protein Gotur_004324, partial [Gossypium turneri]
QHLLSNKRLGFVWDCFRLQKEHGVGKYKAELEGVVIEERANEMEIEDLKGKLQVMKHFGQDDAAVQKKIEEMNNELQEKIDDLQDLGKESANSGIAYFILV